MNDRITYLYGTVCLPKDTFPPCTCRRAINPIVTIASQTAKEKHKEAAAKWRGHTEQTVLPSPKSLPPHERAARAYSMDDNEKGSLGRQMLECLYNRLDPGARRSILAPADTRTEGKEGRTFALMRDLHVRAQQPQLPPSFLRWTPERSGSTC